MRGDGVVTYVARRSVRAGVRQTIHYRCVVAVLPAAIGSGVNRNRVAVGDGLVLRRNGEECLSYGYLAVNEGDVVVSGTDTTRRNGIFAYIARRSVNAGVRYLACECCCIIVALPAGIGNGVCRYSVAVRHILVIRGCGQRSLGNRYCYRIYSGRILMVEVAQYAVVNIVRAGAHSLRQVGLPAIQQGRVETVLEGTVCGLTGCDEGLVRCVINERVNSRRRGIGNRRLGDDRYNRVSDVVRMSLAHELIIYYVRGREGSLRQVGTPFAVIDTVLDMTFLRLTGGDQSLSRSVIYERVISHRIGGDDRCINSLDAESFFKEVACFDIPANEFVAVEVRSRIGDMEQCYSLVLELAVLTDIRYVVLNLRYEDSPCFLCIGQFGIVAYQCFRSIDQRVVFVASDIDGVLDNRIIVD